MPPSQKRQFLTRYNVMSRRSAHQVIATYSTSFSLATGLLGSRVRKDIRNLYAVVRIADEIVDGAAAEAGCSREEITQLLDDYEQVVLQAPSRSFHTDPVLHAYADTARRCNFDPEQLRAFFTSMRRDLHQNSYDPGDFQDYVYGSAEVIGLLCLDIFLVGKSVSPAQRRDLQEGARALGAAFQKVNFLRDLAEDSEDLGRTYFPELEDRVLDEPTKDRLLDDIDADLAAARKVIPLLPLSARAGVLAATDLFGELSRRLRVTPAITITTTRASVPRATKLGILARAVANAPRLKPTRKVK